MYSFTYIDMEKLQVYAYIDTDIHVYIHLYRERETTGKKDIYEERR